MLIETIGLIEIHVDAEEEGIPVRGNAIASGDEAIDKAVERQILHRLHNGDIWAWCTVRVSARIRGTTMESEQYLGCCSYKNAQDFVRSSGYFLDMKSDALTDLLEQVRATCGVQASIEQAIADTKQKMREQYDAQRKEAENAAAVSTD